MGPTGLGIVPEPAMWVRGTNVVGGGVLVLWVMGMSQLQLQSGRRRNKRLSVGGRG